MDQRLRFLFYFRESLGLSSWSLNVLPVHARISSDTGSKTCMHVGLMITSELILGVNTSLLISCVSVLAS